MCSSVSLHGQGIPGTLADRADIYSDEKADEENLKETGEQCQVMTTNTTDIITTNYMWTLKRIPEELPSDLISKKKPVPQFVEPKELICPYCPGPTTPNLTGGYHKSDY